MLASDLKSELDSYDRRRVGVFNDILEYEGKVTAGVSLRQLCEAMPEVGSKDIDFKVMQHFDTGNDDLTRNELRTIRNAFCHNSYPDNEVRSFTSDARRTLHEAEVPGTADKVSERAREISSKTRRR